MKGFLIATVLLLASSLPAEGQQAPKPVSLTQPLPLFAPPLSRLNLDSTIRLPPMPVPRLTTPVRPRPLSGLITPSSGMSVDSRSGSVYRWSKTPNGIRLRGIIPSTGSSWTGITTLSGSITGFDSNMDQWRYNPRTGVRVNTTTGDTCVGQGLAGPCPR